METCVLQGNISRTRNIGNINKALPAIAKEKGFDLKFWLGRRDRVMIAVLYNTGVRVSELVLINKKDITLNQSSRFAANFVILGKVDWLIINTRMELNYAKEALSYL